MGEESNQPQCQASNANPYNNFIEIITQVTPSNLMFFLGIQFSPQINPNIAIDTRPIKLRIGGIPGLVPIKVPIIVQMTTIATIMPLLSCFSPCTAISVTLSRSLGSATVPSF